MFVDNVNMYQLRAGLIKANLMWATLSGVRRDQNMFDDWKGYVPGKLPFFAIQIMVVACRRTIKELPFVCQSPPNTVYMQTSKFILPA